MDRTASVGRVLGFFESFPFFQIGRRPWAFVGPVALTCVYVFYGDLSTPIRVSLIVVPDTFQWPFFLSKACPTSSPSYRHQRGHPAHEKTVTAMTLH